MADSLEVKNLGKRYARFSLKDVSFSIPSGYIMGFVGPNGSGKTTTIKSILGFAGDAPGVVNLLGHDGETATDLFDDIGVVMDEPLYVDEWRISTVEKAVSPFYGRWDKAAFDGLLKTFGIDRKKKVKELSRGMKVKLSMAVALSHGARLLVLDEPTSGLDPVARDELCGLLLDFIAGDENRGVLFSTHITADLERIADYITFILDGRIVYTGDKEELMEKYVMVKGGPGEIDDGHKGLIIGLREHGTGFEGMIETADIGKLPKTLLFERASLDEIIIHINNGEKLHD